MIYRPCIINVAFFLDIFHKVVNVFQERGLQCIVVGDFNEDARSKGPITSSLQSRGFEQKVDFSTTEGGTILDHIYVTDGIYVKVVKVPVYFSYHDAAKVYFRLPHKWLTIAELSFSFKYALQNIFSWLFFFSFSFTHFQRYFYHRKRYCMYFVRWWSFLRYVYRLCNAVCLHANLKKIDLFDLDILRKCRILSPVMC